MSDLKGMTLRTRLRPVGWLFGCLLGLSSCGAATGGAAVNGDASGQPETPFDVGATVETASEAPAPPDTASSGMDVVAPADTTPPPDRDAGTDSAAADRASV